jgi:hypothetical protein
VRQNKPNPFKLVFLFLTFLLMGCVSSGNDASKAPPIDYTGTGLHQASDQPINVSGTIVFKNYQSGPITLEARYSVPCKYGFCPIIGNPPLATDRLSGPGDFVLTMNATPENIMIIASYQPSPSETRVAHVSLPPQKTNISGLVLSLDKPYLPLR